MLHYLSKPTSLVGLGLMIAAILTYVYVWHRDRDAFRTNRGFWRRISYLISHAPDEKNGARPRIIAGLTFLLGVILVIAPFVFTALGVLNDPWPKVGFYLVVVALAVYSYVWLRDRETFKRNRGFWRRVSYLAAHAPDEKSAAWPHIIGGVTLLLGVSLIAAYFIGNAQFVKSQAPETVPSAELSFGVLLAIITFWTLWQTKRIEQLQGERIDGFPNLIRALTQEIQELVELVGDGDFWAGDSHRVVLVSTNPYFGILSYYNSKLRREFGHALEDAADLAGRQHGFVLELLCGSPEKIATFSAKSLGFKERDVNDPSQKRVKQCIDDTEAFLTDLKVRAKRQIAFRSDIELPANQFAVVDNVVFQFILEPSQSGSQIYRAIKFREKIACERYLQTFDDMKKVYREEPTEKMPEGSVELALTDRKN